MKITLGIPPEHGNAAAALYWEAFGGKLGRLLGPRDRALRFVMSILQTDHAICAISDHGALLGVAGFKTSKGAFVDGGFRDLSRHYGLFGACWRSLLFSALERETENERFLMDGICVAQGARGKGVGTALLDAICAEAASRGYAQVRLDVIDSNPRAKALYLRTGFRTLKTSSIGPLRFVFGFGSATSMVRDVTP